MADTRKLNNSQRELPCFWKPTLLEETHSLSAWSRTRWD